MLKPSFKNIQYNASLGKGKLPIVVLPNNDSDGFLGIDELHTIVNENLYTAGAMLFRGFNLYAENDFEQVCKSFGYDLLNYEFGSTPRQKISGKVYTTTEYPAHQSIPLHNEQAYTNNWPLKIWFFCIQAAETQGATPIADSRKVYAQIDPAIRKRFAEKQLQYVRNYGAGLDVSWQDTFNTTDRAAVDAFCKQQNIKCLWKDDGELRTTQICQGVAQHPQTHDWVWFNQAHLFHVSNLPETSRDVLLSIVDKEDLPRNVYYGDGTEIEDSILDEVRGVLAENEVTFPWQNGDLLMLDNMLFAHGRQPFTGERKVVVAMAQDYQSNIHA